MSSLYRKLPERVEHIELAGEPKYTQAVFVGGLKSLPIEITLKDQTDLALSCGDMSAVISRRAAALHSSGAGTKR